MEKIRSEKENLAVELQKIARIKKKGLNVSSFDRVNMLVEIMRQKTSDWLKNKMKAQSENKDLQGFMTKIDLMCKENEKENKKSIDTCMNEQLYVIDQTESTKLQIDKENDKIKNVPKNGYKNINKMPKC